MGNETIYVTARLQARPGSQEALRHEALALTGTTREEAGCLRYELYECTGRPGELLFIEQWQTAADLERHLRQPHIQAFVQKAHNLLDAPMQIEQWRMLA